MYQIKRNAVQSDFTICISLQVNFTFACRMHTTCPLHACSRQFAHLHTLRDMYASMLHVCAFHKAMRLIYCIPELHARTPHAHGVHANISRRRSLSMLVFCIYLSMCLLSRHCAYCMHTACLWHSWDMWHMFCGMRVAYMHAACISVACKPIGRAWRYVVCLLLMKYN